MEMEMYAYYIWHSSSHMTDASADITVCKKLLWDVALENTNGMLESGEATLMSRKQWENGIAQFSIVYPCKNVLKKSTKVCEE